MISVGSVGIKTVMVGGAEAKAVYLGTQQVWTAKRPVVFKGANSSNANSVTLPAHDVGDTIIVLAANSAGSSQPSPPAGWTEVFAGGDGYMPYGCFWLQTTTISPSVVFGNADRIVAAVFRGAATSPIGGASWITNEEVPEGYDYIEVLGLPDTAGNSQIVLMTAGQNATTWNAPPGYTIRHGQDTNTLAATKNDTTTADNIYLTHSGGLGKAVAVHIEIKAA